jgi:hypothetical protein
MKNIISFSLYGEKQLYWKGALKNIQQAKILYPDYVCRFYIDKLAPQTLKDTIVGDNVEVFFMKNNGGIDGMFWRFLGSCDEEVDIFLCRDADSVVNIREKAAVAEWLESDKDFHIMRDHPKHKCKIMGGMWGCRNQIMKKIGFINLVNNWQTRKKYNDDQKFLSNIIYPKIADSAFEHSEYDLSFDNAIYKFPKVTYKGFVGQRL